MDPQILKRVIEAALLAAGQPLSLAQLGALFGETENVTHEDLSRALEELAADCAERGVELKEVASGFRYQVREDVHGWVARLWTERQTKYSRALLETLALIAYRQPITRAEIEQIRGVAVSSSIIKTLEEREWVRVVGYRDVPGRPALFGTSRVFLDYFNLKSLDELPPLAEIRDLDEYDPQLALGPVALGDGPTNAGAANDAVAQTAVDDALDAADADAEADANGTDEDEAAPVAELVDSRDDDADDVAHEPAEPIEHDEPRDAADWPDANVGADIGTDADADADDGSVDRDTDSTTPDSPPDEPGDDADTSNPTTSDDVPEHTA